MDDNSVLSLLQLRCYNLLLFFVFYISIAVTYSLQIHVFCLILVQLIVGLVHYCFFYLNHTYYNACLKFTVFNSPINRCANGEYFWSHFQTQQSSVYSSHIANRFTHRVYSARWFYLSMIICCSLLILSPYCVAILFYACRFLDMYQNRGPVI